MSIGEERLRLCFVWTRYKEVFFLLLVCCHNFRHLPRVYFTNILSATFFNVVFSLLLTWLKSTLLLKIKCFDTTIYMKTQCSQNKWDAALLLKGKVLEKQGVEEKRVALIKSLIMLKMSADTFALLFLHQKITKLYCI